MLVTGSLHCVIGLAIFIAGILALKFSPGGFDTLWMTLIPGIWSLVVGAFGIAAGIDKLPDEKIQSYKNTYMVTAILSAVIFTASGYWVYLSILRGKFEVILYEYTFVDLERFIVISKIGLAFICLEFILAIVSSSICCCCSPTISTPVVIIQQPPQHTMTAAPGFSIPLPHLPTNTGIPYNIFKNESTEAQPPPYTENHN